jgi:hypothetical protein
MAKLDDLRKQRDTMREAADAAHRFGKGVEVGMDRGQKVQEIMDEVLALEEKITKEKAKQAKLASTAGSNARKFKSIQDNVEKSTKETNKSWGSILQNLAKGNILEAISGKSAVRKNIAQKDLAKHALVAAQHAKDMKDDENKETKLKVADYGKVLDIQKGITDGSIKDSDISEQLTQLTETRGENLEKVEANLRNLADQKKKEVGVTKKLEEAEERRASNAKRQNIINAAALGIYGALYKLATQFAQRIDEIGSTFGDLTNIGPDLVSQLTAAGVEAEKLGFSQADVLATTTSLSSEFGLSLTEATGLSNQVLRTAKATGLSADEGTKLFGVLMQTADLSADQAERLAEGAAQLARQAGVAPQAVMRDMAGSAEEIAEFTKDGGENIAEAAVQARQMGLSLSTTAKIAKGLLDFESSITNEIEASVLIGRQLDFQRARQLALSGDIAGATKDIVAQLGSEADFNALNLIQRESLAKSIGVSVGELAKMVGQTDKLTLSGAMAAGSFDDLSGQKALSNLSKITNEVKALFSEALILIGPEIENLAEKFKIWIEESGGVAKLKDTFLGIASAIGGLIGHLPNLIGLMVALKVASLGAMLIQAGLAAAATAAATPWMWGGGAVLAAAAIIGAYNTVAMAVDDFKSGPGGITHMMGPAGVFSLNPRDSVLATTNRINDGIITGDEGSFANFKELLEAQDVVTGAAGSFANFFKELLVEAQDVVTGAAGFFGNFKELVGAQRDSVVATTNPISVNDFSLNPIDSVLTTTNPPEPIQPTLAPNVGRESAMQKPASSMGAGLSDADASRIGKAMADGFDGSMCAGISDDDASRIGKAMASNMRFETTVTNRQQQTILDGALNPLGGRLITGIRA